MGSKANDAEIVPFSETWMEGLLDLLERGGIVDPLYGTPSTREETRGRIRSRIASGLTRASVVAVRGDEVVGSAHANQPPLCGETEKGMAWLSVTVPLDETGQAVGARLVERICAELSAQGVGLLRIGMLDGWREWCGFLRRCGFARNEAEQTADALLPADAPVPAAPETDEVVRPIRLPGERRAVLDFIQRQLAEDLPDSCAPEGGGRAWWDHWPDFDPSGFLVAEDRASGEIVGYVLAVVVRDDRGPRGIVDGMDVAKGLVGTKLRKRLLLQAVAWLRGKGTGDVRYRVHVGYRDEEAVFERLGFRLENAAAIWYRPTG